MKQGSSTTTINTVEMVTTKPQHFSEHKFKLWVRQFFYDQNSLRKSYNRFVSNDFTLLYFKYTESSKISKNWFRKSTDHA